MIRAARIARDAGLPVVADFERDPGPRFPELLGLADHLIVSRDFALRLTGARTPAEAAAALWQKERCVVVITAGAAGYHYLTQDLLPEVRHRPAFPVAALDTTGCGDVFHGAYASALARGMAVEARLEFASAAAALKSTAAGGQAGIPSRQLTEDFLRSQSTASP
jgi:sugar/nucleoside kinase (ribokinase family)